MMDVSAIKTDVAATARTRRRSPWWYVPLGLLIGTVMGAISRGWMRLISDDPEFSWSGTIFIVAAFTVAGVGHGLAWAARSAAVRRRWSTAARLTGALLTLPLFAGAGAVMLPTIAAGSMARWRTDWVRPVRALLALVAGAIPAVLLGDVARGGVNLGRLLGMALFVGTYASIVAGMRAIAEPLGDGWRVPRAARLALVAAAPLVLIVILLSTVGLATS